MRSEYPTSKYLGPTIQTTRAVVVGLFRAEGTGAAGEARSVGVWWGNENSQGQAGRGNTVGEGLAAMTLSTCLQALVQVDQ